MTPDLIFNYFPGLTARQKEQFEALYDIYAYWNQRINLISRKDFAHFYLHHVLHSLGIAKVIRFLPGTGIIDVGTGGGFPGVPLAIMFPEANFFLVDSIGKKIRVVRDVAERLELQNVSAAHIRAEELKSSFDFIVSRAVTNLPDFIRITEHLLRHSGNNALPNGLLYLKGGDFENEVKAVARYSPTIYPLANFFVEEFFQTKKVIHLSRGR